MSATPCILSVTVDSHLADESIGNHGLLGLVCVIAEAVEEVADVVMVEFDLSGDIEKCGGRHTSVL